MSINKLKLSSQRSDELQSVSVRKMEEEPRVVKRKTMLLQEGDIVLGGEGPVRKPDTPAPKPRRKRGGPSEEGGEGRRRRKPKPIVEVNSTFTELRRLLQDMRPSTLQVLRTPYYRNCKAARNMRKGVRQIRDFCKQVRLETVMLSKKKGDDIPKKRRKPDAATSPLEASASKTGQDLDLVSPSHSVEVPSRLHEKRSIVAATRETSETNERTKPEPSKSKILVPKSEISSPAPKERERDRSPKRDRIKSPMEMKSPKKERSPRRDRERERERERDRERERERERERDRSPRKGKDKSSLELERERERLREREREISPRPIQKKQKVDIEIDLEEESPGNSDDSE